MSMPFCDQSADPISSPDISSSLKPPWLGADEVDAIAPKRETAQREMERRIVAQMLTCLDDLAASLPAGEPAASEAGPSLQPDAAQRQYRHVVVIGEPAQPFTNVGVQVSLAYSCTPCSGSLPLTACGSTSKS